MHLPDYQKLRQTKYIFSLKASFLVGVLPDFEDKTPKYPRRVKLKKISLNGFVNSLRDKNIVF